MAELRIQSLYGGERRIPLKPRTTVGRAEESDVFLPDQFLSRKHAEIQQRAEGWKLVDLGSTNGTYLNGSRVRHEIPLRDGDVITLGETTLTYTEKDEASGVIALFGAQTFSLSELSARTTKPTMDVTELVQQNRVLGILSRATGALLGNYQLPELFERIMDLVFDGLPADRAAIMLLEGSDPRPIVKASRSRNGAEPIVHVSNAIARRVVEGQVALLLPDVLQDTALRSRESLVNVGVRSAMCAPLWFTPNSGATCKVLGLVYVDSRSFSPAFSEAELQILTVLANLAAAKIENAWLLEENLEKRRLEDDMALAAEIQDSLLPRVAPHVPGYDIIGATRSCRAVGGDYYDFMFDGHRLHLALGDVSGKGTGAAMLMTALRASVRAHWLEGQASEATWRINRTFHQCVPDDKYATFFMGRLDVTEGRFTYVNAGHNRPLLVRAQGHVEVLADGGLIIGAFEVANYKEGVVGIYPGDTLLIFSDGVSDTWPDPDIADSKLVEIIRDGRSRSAADIQQQIFREVDRQTGTRPGDDRTVVVLKRLAS